MTTPSQRNYTRRIKEERKSKGLCIECGKASAFNSYVRCEACLIKTRKAGQACRAAKLAAGLCEKCCKPRASGRSRCEDCLKEQREFAKEYHAELKDAAFNAYGGYKCNCCGMTYTAGLELDHVNGGGNKHRRETKANGVYLWLKVNNYPAGMMQVLCATCNKAKHREGVCRCKEYHTIIPITTSNSN